MDVHKIATIYPLLPDNELEALAEDMRQHGQRMPIITYENQILDGRNRYKACELAGVKPRYEPFIGTALDAVAYVVSANEKRRHLTSSQAAACEYKRLELVAEYRAAVAAAREAARERPTAGRPRKENSSQTFDVNLSPPPRVSAPKGRTDTTRATIAKTNRQYIHDVAAIAKAKPEAVDQIIAGEKTIPQVKREIRQEAPPPPPVITPGFPDGPFRCIVIDPPWPIEKIAFERRPTEKIPMDYATMSLDEIAALPIPRLAHPEGSHIYLWVTHRFLPEGLRLFEKWGVRYECVLTWVKPTAQPLWWRYLTEHLLFGKIGSLAPLVKGEAVCFNAPQQRHSHKPDEFFALARRVSPEPRLTMFDGQREGFTSWGVAHYGI